MNSEAACLQSEPAGRALPRAAGRWGWIFAIVAPCTILIVAPLVGHFKIPVDAVLMRDGADPVAVSIFWDLRVPRVALAAIAGGALSLSGMVFQALFRNPLATPFTLGVSSGAALGAAIATKCGFLLLVPWLGATSLCAFVGALLTIVLVLAISGGSTSVQSASLLLSGVIVSFFVSSLILLVQYLSDAAEVFGLTRWLMGSLDTVGVSDPLSVLMLVLPGVALTLLLCKELDVMVLGDELASSRGVAVVRTRLLLLGAASLMVSAVVSICGPIGFVGLIVPLACRGLSAGSHLRLSLLSCIVGASFLTLCDTLGRVVISPAEIPVGVITALLGGPFFLAVLRRQITPH